MIEITAEIRALIDKAAAGVELAGDEYIDPADCLLYTSGLQLNIYLHYGLIDGIKPDNACGVLSENITASETALDLSLIHI